jgi:hypothetical protein
MNATAPGNASNQAQYFRYWHIAPFQIDGVGFWMAILDMATSSVDMAKSCVRE